MAAIGFTMVAAILIVVALTKDEYGVAHQILADLALGDVITIGNPR